MRSWRPVFACPECTVAAGLDLSGDVVCDHCRRRFDYRDGVFRFLTPDRLAAAEPLVRQYRAVRAREGYLGRTAEYYRMLPCVPPDDPHAAEWRIRAESFQQLQRFVLPPGGSAAVRVLDLGAGNGWLSHRLSSLGHHVVALDRLDDGEDGLGACRHYPTPFLRVQADFDALPFVPNQFDLVVFIGSLHYAPDVPATLARALQPHFAARASTPLGLALPGSYAAPLLERSPRLLAMLTGLERALQRLRAGAAFADHYCFEATRQPA